MARIAAFVKSVERRPDDDALPRARASEYEKPPPNGVKSKARHRARMQPGKSSKLKARCCSYSSARGRLDARLADRTDKVPEVEIQSALQ
jgi:hypothetical protein